MFFYNKSTLENGYIDIEDVELLVENIRYNSLLYIVGILVVLTLIR